MLSFNCDSVRTIGHLERISAVGPTEEEKGGVILQGSVCSFALAQSLKLSVRHVVCAKVSSCRRVN